MTEGERRLWRHLRGKQVRNVRFYRQRPIGDYVVDFYAPAPKLVVEVDGGQHYDDPGLERDAVRDAFLMEKGLEVLRYTNREVLENIEGVLESICRAIEGRSRP